MGCSLWVCLFHFKSLSFLIEYALSRQCIYVLHGHRNTIRCMRVLKNRPIAITGSRDNDLRVWDVQKGVCLRVLSGHLHNVRCMDISGNKLVSGSYDSTCRVSCDILTTCMPHHSCQVLNFVTSYPIVMEYRHW